MARPMGKIRIMLSARVLFDLEEADAIFKEKGEKEYADYMRGRGKYAEYFDPDLGGRALAKGPMWSFAQAALALNKPGQEPVVELGLLCKDTGETAIPIFRNLDVNGLKDIQYRKATAGNPLDMAAHQAFGTDLLLTRNPEDVQMTVNNDIAAAVINVAPRGVNYDRKPGGPLEIYLDGDAVAVGSSAEVIFQEGGLDVYRKNEADHFDDPIEAGPFTAFLAKVSALNAQFPTRDQPFKLSLLTARGADSGVHMITAAEKLGINFNGSLNFMGGSSKVDVIKAEKPDIFFDDQQVHLQESKNYAPTGQVAYKEGSPMDLFLKAQAKKKVELQAAHPDLKSKDQFAKAANDVTEKKDPAKIAPPTPQVKR